MIPVVGEDPESLNVLLADRAPVALWIMGQDQRLLFHNRRTAGFVGRAIAQLLKDGWTGVVHPQDFENVQAKYSAAVAAHRGFRIECRMRRANRGYAWVLHAGVPWSVHGEFAGHIGTSLDITHLRRSHERMMAAQKLQSLGTLTAGIAHDFNTLVGSIFAASDLALFDLPPDSPVRENISRIYAAATRASEIVNLLMAYTGTSAARIEPIDLSHVVAEVLQRLYNKIPVDVALDVRLSPGLPAVLADSSQIRQVISNLLINAVESLGRQKGEVRVVTERQGEFCRLAVSDTGCGMPADVCARAYDPFFTTKFLGRGLGLAAVQGIVRSLGGSIQLSSAPGTGSTFEVLMPCAKRPVDKTQLLKHATAGASSPES